MRDRLETIDMQYKQKTRSWQIKVGFIAQAFITYNAFARADNKRIYIYIRGQ